MWTWSRIKQLELENETLKMQLACVLVAANGQLTREPRQEWRSPALSAVFALRKQLMKLGTS